MNYGIRKIFSGCAVILSCFLICSCAPMVGQYYPDTFYPEDSIYENRLLHFVMTFSGNWNIMTDPNTMDSDSRKLARDLRKSGLELLFIGENIEGFIGTRGIAVNLNEPARDYAEYIQEINAADVQNDKGLSDFYIGTYPAIQWIYEKMGFRFSEFFITLGTYDIRIAFWTKTELFDNFLPVFEQIMNTLTITRYY